MSRRILVFLGALAVAAGQTASKSWTPPRTPDGQPDLQGIWNTATLTPLQRPANLAGQEFFSEQEVEAFEKESLTGVDADRRDGGAGADVGRAYNEFWRDRGRVVPTRRTSLIIDPPDGRVPALTPEAQKRNSARAEARRLRPADGPEDRSLAERCVAVSNAGPPMMPANYNSNYQILQSPGYVVILSEQIHDARVIPTDGRPHAPANVRQYLGDSRGRWEGDTLVVETTNFTDETAFQGSGPGMRLIERFTRTAPETIVYEFTVDDPASFVRPWTAQMFMTRTDELLYEYACHEGNYGIEGVLAGFRAAERAAGGR
jgi:hypothetical protein